MQSTHHTLTVIANRRMELSLEKILLEIDNGAHYGNQRYKYSGWLEQLSKKSNFLKIISQEMSIAAKSKNFGRFNFLAFILQGFGNDSPNQENAYIEMMKFVSNNIEFDQKSNEESDGCLELVLDVFWHQEEGLKNLNQFGQEQLYATLKRATSYRYERSENRDEPFFAINKSMDLIKYQDKYGNTNELNESYLNHFDEYVRQRATETIKRL